MRLFISYSRDDIRYVSELADLLRDDGNHSIWFDKSSIVGGDSWWEAILKGIEDCESFVTILTPLSLSSFYCAAELAYALVLNKPVLPLMLKRIEVPPNLSALQVEDISAINLDRAYARCERALGQISLRLERGVYRPPAEPPARPSVPTSKANVDAPDTTAPATGTAESLKDITKAKARAMVLRADQTHVQPARDLLREALFVMDLNHWPGNRDEPRKALNEIKVRLKNPVLISKETVEEFVEHAEMTIENCAYPADSDMVNQAGFDCVKDMLGPFLPIFPTKGDYELSLFAYPPEIYVPLLLIELSSSRESPNYWNALSLLADSEYGSVLLPDLEELLSDIRSEGWEYWQVVRLARLVLVGEFDEWYLRVRQRTYDDDRAFMKEEWDKWFKKNSSELSGP